MILKTVLAVLACLGAGAAVADSADPSGFAVETEILSLHWVETPDSTEVAEITAETTLFYGRVAAMLGDDSGRKITIVLAGPSEQPDGTRKSPHVDWMGRVMLYRFTPDFHNYYGALAHELVHAFRFDRRRDADWFFEEGFAEFVALRVDPSLSGFPWFDYPPAVVAGQWLDSGEEIPLHDLRSRHAELNSRCTAQSYALRGAFFEWLGREYGDNAVLQAGEQNPAGSDADYELAFGESFETLATKWKAAALEEYRSLEGSAEAAKRYRTQSPIKYQKVCAEGTDF